MRRAIVHVGMPRTGTTSLQRVLYGVRRELAGVGVLYPDLTPASAAEAHLNHQHLGEALDGRRPAVERRELLGKLEGQLASSDADVVVVSYEGLCLLAPGLGVPGMLAGLFARHGFAMETLVTLKPQAEWINSSYTWRTQFLREGRVFSRYFRSEARNWRLDYSRLVEQWRGACDGRLMAVPVRDARSGAPLFERAMGEVGLWGRVSGLIAPGDLVLRDNQSPGPVAVEAARRLRLGGAQVGLGPHAREATRFAEEEARRLGFDGVAFNGVDGGMLEEEGRRWGAANDRFARVVWGEDWELRAGGTPVRAVNEVVCTGDARGVEAVVGAVCGRFGVGLGGGWGASVRSGVAGGVDWALRVGRAWGATY